MSGSPMFGRRRTEADGPQARPIPAAAQAPAMPTTQMVATSTSESLIELRALALSQLDPGAAGIGCGCGAGAGARLRDGTASSSVRRLPNIGVALISPVFQVDQAIYPGPAGWPRAA